MTQFLAMIMTVPDVIGVVTAFGVYSMNSFNLTANSVIAVVAPCPGRSWQSDCSAEWDAWLGIIEIWDGKCVLAWTSVLAADMLTSSHNITSCSYEFLPRVIFPVLYVVN